MRMLLCLLLGCSKNPPIAASAEAVEEKAVAVEPAEGWYNGGCYAALDGRVDVALEYLSCAIEEGSAPLVWMGEDPDLASVRADSRYRGARDEAIDAWIAANSPATGQDWLQVAEARMVQDRDPTDALLSAEEAGVVYPVFGTVFPSVTSALEDAATRRGAWIDARRGIVTVENPDSFELAKIVLALTAFGQGDNATDRSTLYSKQVDAWFAPYRDHALIQDLDALPVDMNVYYAFRNQSAAWELRQGQLSPSEVYAVGGFWGGDDPFASRVELVEDFVKASDAQSFLDAHAEERGARIAAYEASVPIRAMWDWLELRFPAQGDGRDALVVRTSALIGGSHNASTLVLDGFTEGTMVVPAFLDGEVIEPEHVGPLARMVFTEVDHHYVNPVSDRMRPAIDAAIPDYKMFNEKADEWGYASPYLTFNEYATWVLFDVWWAEHCDTVGCSPEQRVAGAEDTVGVMRRRGFHRYTEFRDAMVPQLAGQADMEVMFPAMLEWFGAQVAAPQPGPN